MLQWAASGNLVKKKKKEKREEGLASEGTATRERLGSITVPHKNAPNPVPVDAILHLFSIMCEVKIDF